jgi:hypothetical protein
VKIKNEKNKLMKMNSVYTATLLLAASVCLEADQAPQPKAGSPEFERMKSLIGSWQGRTDIGQGPIDINVQYRLLAAGSVLEERVFAGTPNEMVTMYYDKDGKLALTHYCMMGNRPGMTLKSADPKTIRFDFDKSCGLNSAKESHMHALTLTFNDPDTITTSCKAIVDGKESEEHPTTLKRVQKDQPIAKN